MQPVQSLVATIKSADPVSMTKLKSLAGVPIDTVP